MWIYMIPYWLFYSRDDIFTNFTKKVAFRENIIVRALHCYTWNNQLANGFVKIKSRMFKNRHSWNINPVNKRASTVLEYFLCVTSCCSSCSWCKQLIINIISILKYLIQVNSVPLHRRCCSDSKFKCLSLSWYDKWLIDGIILVAFCWTISIFDYQVHRKVP